MDHPPPCDRPIGALVATRAANRKAQRSEPGPRRLDFLVVGGESIGGEASSSISFVRTLVSVEGLRSFHLMRWCRLDLLDHDVIPFDGSCRPVGVKHHPSPARSELGVPRREILGLHVPGAPALQVLLVAIDLASSRS